MSDTNNPQQHTNQSSVANLRAFGLLYPGALTVANLDAADAPLVFVNSAFETLTGYQSAEIIGHNCRFLQGGQRDPLQIDPLRAAVEQHQLVCLDIDNVRQSGERFLNRLLLIPLACAEGSFAIGLQSEVPADHRIKGMLVAEQLSESVAHFDATLAKVRQLSQLEEEQDTDTQDLQHTRDALLAMVDLVTKLR